MFAIWVSENAAKAELTKRFYDRLIELEEAGEMHFETHRHGKRGVSHHAVTIPAFTIEIYPQTKWLPAGQSLNAHVQFPEAAKAELIAHFGGQELEPDEKPESDTVILRDPNGKVVRLLAAPHPTA